MSAHIPPFRRALMGRTWDQEWRPEAIEHHRVSFTTRLVRGEWRMYAAFLAFLWAMVSGWHLLAVFWG